MRRLILPLVVIALGVVFLAHNLGYLPLWHLRRLLEVWWPVILIAVGVLWLVRRGR
jgi:hypothetical protein